MGWGGVGAQREKRAHHTPQIRTTAHNTPMRCMAECEHVHATRAAMLIGLCASERHDGMRPPPPLHTVTTATSVTTAAQHLRGEPLEGGGAVCTRRRGRPAWRDRRRNNGHRAKRAQQQRTRATESARSVHTTARTTMLQGIVHLVIFVAFLFFAVVP